MLLSYLELKEEAEGESVTQVVCGVGMQRTSSNGLVSNWPTTRTTAGKAVSPAAQYSLDYLRPQSRWRKITALFCSFGLESSA